MHPAIHGARPGVILLALALLLGAGCDTVDPRGLSKEYLLGTWVLDGVRDDGGDRTAAVRLAVDELRVRFYADDTFDLRIQYTQAAGQPDAEVSGTFAVSPSGQVVLTSSGVALPLNGVVRGDDELELSAPAAMVTLILAVTDINLELAGTVVLTMGRRAG
jgi:hypothetical protein